MENREEKREENREENRRLGKYRIIRTLGQGGEGCVYLARDESLSRLVAVKGLRNRTREAAFLRDLRHPMLPVVYELFYEEGWYLVMEYIDGISLHNYIRAKGSVEEEQARLWAAALLDVLSYLHTRETPVIYRDLKPDNIMVCRNGSLRLVDFGAAGFHRFGEGGEGRMAYTSGFAAPEQKGAGGEKAWADERSDIYACGKTLYYMLTGADPGVESCTALPLSAYNPLLSAELERIVRRCIAEEPEARYQAAAEAMRDLQKRGRYRSGRKRDFVRHVENRFVLRGLFIYNSVKRSSNAHSIGCFAKNF